jgi:hypothetical protein
VSRSGGSRGTRFSRSVAILGAIGSLCIFGALAFHASARAAAGDALSASYRSESAEGIATWGSGPASQDLLREADRLRETSATSERLAADRRAARTLLGFLGLGTLSAAVLMHRREQAVTVGRSGAPHELGAPRERTARASPAVAAAPETESRTDPTRSLLELKDLLDRGLISEDESRRLK